MAEKRYALSPRGRGVLHFSGNHRAWHEQARVTAERRVPGGCSVSKLARKIATTQPPLGVRDRRGPVNKCFPLYGLGDLEDWEAVEALRTGRSWREVQEHVDTLAKVEKPLLLEAFRRHWRRRCWCWPEDLRR